MTILFSVYSCKNGDPIPPTGNQTVTVTVIPPSELSTRVAVTEDLAPLFQWKDGETIPLFLLLRQSATSSTYTTIYPTLSVQSNLKSSFTFTLPTGYTAGTAQVAAITGKQTNVNTNGAWATGIDPATVMATIGSTGAVDMANTLNGNTNVQYNVPLFSHLLLSLPLTA